MGHNDSPTFINKTRHRYKRLIKRSRVIPVPGQPIDAYRNERLYRCWYCGDINTTGRDEEDDGNSHMSSTYSMPVRLSRGAMDGKNASISINSSIFTTRIAPVADYDGNAKSVKNVWAVTAHRGCKACGTINWSGKY